MSTLFGASSIPNLTIREPGDTLRCASQGELRVKVSRPDCAHEIMSVALRLELSEFSEVVYLKEGAVLPDVVQRARLCNCSLAYENATSDSDIWHVGAEERIAWTSEIVLLKDHPVVLPFTVDVPNVNYPPGVNRMRVARNSRHSLGDLAYELTFTDGRIVERPVGYTTFVPMHEATPTESPYSRSVTFKNGPCDEYYTNPHELDDLQRCLPKEERSQFTAEVILETGNIVQQGHRVKGRITIHTTQGSTTMSEITVGVLTHYDDRWASEQAITGGDADFVDARYADTRCRTYSNTMPLDAESPSYAWLFTGERRPIRVPFANVASNADDGSDPLTPEHPYFNFDFEVPRETPVDFPSYYTTTENRLLFKLDVLYSPEVADCLGKPMSRPPVMAADAAAATEERMWQTHSPVGHPGEFERKDTRRTMTLEALVPITVVGGTVEDAHPAPHYLAPGLPVPVIRAAGEIGLEYPIADPVVKEEPLAETTSRLIQAHKGGPWAEMMSRLMESHSRYVAGLGSPLAEEIPDPTRYYRRGDYAGLLWKKKKVAEERGFPSFRPETAETEVGGDQQPLGL
ncbi:hypothetical protein FB45DRAFT_1056393 [Roridomyces roridus]|uniref:Uncharacterized protein n=1 Tax=Roridomyces roridus TaxID=1738132 RepID=A0AAD7FTM3_9AGAR|nr:hypothetical protein FB45DRAFT_1056393 [Roridomyces roridus]